MESNTAHVIKCNSCGADMVYSPEKGMLACPYCDITKEIEKSVPKTRDFVTERSEGIVDESMNQYKCPNCGGEIELENFQTAKKCPFCGATNIVQIENIKGMKPDSILPFTYSKNMAFEASKKWMRRKIFAPRKLRKNFKPDNFNGVYIPTFLFDAKTQSSYDGVLGERRTRTVGSGDNRHTETYIHWYHVSGNVSNDFNDLVIEASTQINQKEIQKLEPFDTLANECYKREYLAGFSAERYDTSLDDSYAIAKQKMDSSIKKMIIHRYHADEVRYLNINTSYADIKFNYSLLPLWICGYKFKEKVYRFLVNGRTGKSTGKTPLSPIKITITALIGLGIIALLVWLFVFSGILQ